MPNINAVMMAIGS